MTGSIDTSAQTVGLQGYPRNTPSSVNLDTAFQDTHNLIKQFQGLSSTQGVALADPETAQSQRSLGTAGSGAKLFIEDGKINFQNKEIYPDLEIDQHDFFTKSDYYKSGKFTQDAKLVKSFLNLLHVKDKDKIYNLGDFQFFQLVSILAAAINSKKGGNIKDQDIIVSIPGLIKSVKDKYPIVLAQTPRGDELVRGDDGKIRFNGKSISYLQSYLNLIIRDAARLQEPFPVLDNLERGRRITDNANENDAIELLVQSLHQYGDIDIKTVNEKINALPEDKKNDVKAHLAAIYRATKENVFSAQDRRDTVKIVQNLLK